jgi:hypothetical protein
MLANVEKQIMGAVQAGQVCYVREQRIVHTFIRDADGKDYPVECMGHLCKGNKHYMVVMKEVVCMRPFVCSYALVDTGIPARVEDGKPVMYSVEEVLDYLTGMVLD